VATFLGRIDPSDLVGYLGRSFKREWLRVRYKLADWEDIIEEGGAKFTNVEVQRAVITDDDAALSALFRFCLASSLSQADLADHYFPAALLQYLRYPDAYDNVWGSFLPDGFRGLAMECRGALLSKGVEEYG
jgi:hypothetical protein